MNVLYYIKEFNGKNHFSAQLVRLVIDNPDAPVRLLAKAGGVEVSDIQSIVNTYDLNRRRSRV